MALATLLLGLLLGALLRETEVRYLRKELATATDRLVQAWHGGAVVGSRPDAPVVDDTPPPLPPLLQSYVDDWENPETRRAQEALFRKQYFEQGMSEKAIVLQLEDARRE